MAPERISELLIQLEDLILDGGNEIYNFDEIEIKLDEIREEYYRLEKIMNSAS